MNIEKKADKKFEVANTSPTKSSFVVSLVDLHFRSHVFQKSHIQWQNHYFSTFATLPFHTQCPNRIIWTPTKMATNFTLCILINPISQQFVCPRVLLRCLCCTWGPPAMRIARSVFTCTLRLMFAGGESACALFRTRLHNRTRTQKQQQHPRHESVSH